MIDLNCNNSGENLLNYGNHLEVALKENKKPSPPDNTGKIIATITIGLTLTFILEVSGLIEIVLASETVLPPISAPPNPPDSHPIPPPEIPPGNPGIPTNIGGSNEEEPYVMESGIRDVQIHDCNGYYLAANFRAYADYEPAAIKGAVRQGEWVRLTGATLFEDGILWHEAINYSPLVLSEDGYIMYHQSQENQVGWIAGCFVR